MFGIDGLQAMHLAIKCAAAVLESLRPELAWSGEKDDLGMPKFIPELPKPQRDRLEAMVEGAGAQTSTVSVGSLLSPATIVELHVGRSQRLDVPVEMPQDLFLSMVPVLMIVMHVRIRHRR